MQKVLAVKQQWTTSRGVEGVAGGREDGWRGTRHTQTRSVAQILKPAARLIVRPPARSSARHGDTPDDTYTLFNNCYYYYYYYYYYHNDNKFIGDDDGVPYRWQYM